MLKENTLDFTSFIQSFLFSCIIFTEHAADKIERRRFMKDEIIESIKFPDITIKKHGKYYYQKTLERGKVEIVCERTEKHIKVITQYWI
ncbi:DUF4258 domain-containing protein [Candidatus Woesearchaeota archaeon]|nr:DUF4258 domain-containing protein [Candidatus Woesearchaeota archaeon]